MSGVPFKLRKTDIRSGLCVHEQYRDELNKELVEINIEREIILAFALIILVSVILAVNMLSHYTEEESLYVSIASYRIHILMLLISITFIITASILRRKIDRNIFVLGIIHIFINSFVLTLCSIIAVNNELSGQRPFSYLTAMLCIGSMVIMPTAERLAVYGFSWIIYQAGLILWVKNPMTILQNVIFISLIMLLSLLISKVNYSAYISIFINKKALEEKSEELDRLYKLTEENLQKRTEELNHTVELEKIRAVFFANISHELRTPLNIIFSAEQMLERTLKDVQLPEKQKEVSQYVRIMKQNCYRMTRLITNLIDMTKIDAGYMQYDPQNCDFIKIVEDITLSTAKYVEGKGISLTFDTDIEEKTILCDPDKVERIVLNLISNAVKFTPEGGNIYVSICDKSSKLILSVKDDGIGIPFEMKDQIFERFVQVDKTYTRDREGSGIGLSLVKSLVEMHGGSIAVESKLGEGSEFIIEMPVIQTGDGSICSECGYMNTGQRVEKVSIEFSDIYD